MNDTFLLTRCQEGKPHPIGWAHRDIYGEICLKDILATNMTVNMSVGLSAYQKSSSAAIPKVVVLQLLLNQKLAVQPRRARLA